MKDAEKERERDGEREERGGGIKTPLAIVH